jgi:hypothetical protein
MLRHFLYRDLHCWDLSIQWTPFGYYKSYNVNIKGKSSYFAGFETE